MKTKYVLSGLAIAVALGATTRPAAADFFDNGGPLCSLLTIGCPPPPPPPPPPPVVAEPEPGKPVRHMRKKRIKKAAPKAAAAPAEAAPPAPAPGPQ